jgi:hypothetical protein
VLKVNAKEICDEEILKRRYVNVETGKVIRKISLGGTAFLSGNQSPTVLQTMKREGKKWSN